MPVYDGSAVQVAAALASTYQLEIIDNWRIGSLGRDCFAFEIQANKGLTQSLIQIDADPRVESVQTMRYSSVAGAPSRLKIDPYVNLQHSLFTARIDESHQLSTGENVKVAIIDTGLDRSIYDLRDRVDVALNFVDADQTIEVVEFHATAVAGIIGATANYGRGIVGIAPGARMYFLRACWESDPGSSRGQCSSRRHNCNCGNRNW